MILENFEPFIGQHCETTTTGSLLNQIGIELSEPMLFGLGEGLGFIYFSFKSMPFPFIGGRSKSGEITEKLCKNLQLRLNVKETTSVKKAWHNVMQELNAGKAVGLQLDCYHLDYFTDKIHFAGHFTAMYGFDEQFAYLVDTDQQGTRSKTTLESLALARNERGPMSAKNKSYTIEKGEQDVQIEKGIIKAIIDNSNVFLNPPIRNLGYKGILKASKEIKRWFKTSEDVKGDFQTTAMLMERAGTGGSLFRNLYRDFLGESYDLLGVDALKVAYEDYSEIADLWKGVADLFHLAGGSADYSYIEQASVVMADLSERERVAMTGLNNAFELPAI